MISTRKECCVSSHPWTAYKCPHFYQFPQSDWTRWPGHRFKARQFWTLFLASIPRHGRPTLSKSTFGLTSYRTSPWLQLLFRLRRLASALAWRERRPSIHKSACRNLISFCQKRYHPSYKVASISCQAISWDILLNSLYHGNASRNLALWLVEGFI